MIDLMRLLPQSLLQDEFVCALTEAFEKQMRELYDEFYFIAGKLAKNDMHGLPEKLIDYLAYEKHVDFYENLTYDEKCRVVATAYEMHRKKGTKYALENVLSMLDLRGEIQEWFEYGGEPYFFKVKVMDNANKGVNEDIIALLERLINAYKNNRSWIENFEFYLTTRATPRYGSLIKAGENLTVYPKGVN